MSRHRTRRIGGVMTALAVIVLLVAQAVVRPTPAVASQCCEVCEEMESNCASECAGKPAEQQQACQDACDDALNGHSWSCWNNCSYCYPGPVPSGCTNAIIACYPFQQGYKCYLEMWVC